MNTAIRYGYPYPGTDCCYFDSFSSAGYDSDGQKQQAVIQIHLLTVSAQPVSGGLRMSTASTATDQCKSRYITARGEILGLSPRELPSNPRWRAKDWPGGCAAADHRRMHHLRRMSAEPTGWGTAACQCDVAHEDHIVEMAFADRLSSC